MNRPGEAGEPVHRRIGVIDAGSNSIRLVVYDGLTRAPLPIVNRKAEIGLGTDVERYGRIEPGAFRQAVSTIAALARTAEDMPVAELAVLGTAAVREARNGGEFRAAVKDACGHVLTVLSGDEEARLAALGVLSASPDAAGIVGDLGGGSLELIAVDRGEVLRRASLPIGPLRLIARTGGRLHEAAAEIDRGLATIAWLDDWRQRRFFAVGGAWRALARLYMGQRDYPLRIVHGFHLRQRQARDFAAMVEHLGSRTTARIRSLTPGRAETLPWGAAVLERVMSATRPAEIVFSAHGLREGYHFSRLDRTVQRQDPLLAACRDLARRHRRLDPGWPHIVSWLAPLADRLDQVPKRLVEASAILSETGRDEHPEYRAEQAMSRALLMPWSVLAHHERAFLGLALHARFGGSSGAAAAGTCRRLLGEDAMDAARILGRALRLALELCAGCPRRLAEMPLLATPDGFEIAVPDEVAVVTGDRIERHADALSRGLGRTVGVAVAAAPAARDGGRR